MNTDIRISVTFLQNPKIKKLERRIGLEGLKALLALWIWTAQNKPTGDLAGLDGESVEMAADWAGDEGAFIQTLKALRLLDGEEGSYSIHDWVENNGWAANESDRADTSRFNRMKGVAAYKTIHDTLAEAGVSRISKEDYELLRNSGERQAVVERLLKSAPSISKDVFEGASEEREATQEETLSNAQAMLDECSSSAQSTADNRLSNALSPSPTPSPSPRPMPAPLASNTNSASGDAPRAQARKSRPVLEGKRLESFNRFWKAYGWPKGKGGAEKAWAAIPSLTDALVDRICEAAAKEAAQRPALQARGLTPKWAQGWLNERRWEDDYEATQPQPQARPAFQPQGQQKTWDEIRDERNRQACLNVLNELYPEQGFAPQEEEYEPEHCTAEILEDE